MNLEGLIPLVFGLYLLLAARGTVKMSKDLEEEEAWRSRWGGTINWLAPAVMLFGILLLLNVI